VGVCTCSIVIRIICRRNESRSSVILSVYPQWINPRPRSVLEASHGIAGPQPMGGRLDFITERLFGAMPAGLSIHPSVRPAAGLFALGSIDICRTPDRNRDQSTCPIQPSSGERVPLTDGVERLPPFGISVQLSRTVQPSGLFAESWRPALLFPHKLLI
jgi:hypothetical protein